MSPRRLLLFDEDPAVLERVAGWLQRDDRRIQGVGNAREALNHLRDAAYDVVVAGPWRNGCDGVKLLRRMRSVRPDAKVILTGDRNPARAVAALRAHAYSYLHQPPAPGPLAEIVQYALDSSSWRDDLQVISARPEWVTVDVRCKLEAAERATHLLRESAVELSAAACEDVTAAFHELLMNAIEHGCGLNPRKHVRISLLRTPRALMVHIQDSGRGFSLARLPHAAVNNPEDSPIRHVEIRAEQGQRPGGFGILMASKLVDDLVYNERGNEVFFVKNIA